MSRVKNYQTIVENVSAIQFVRNAIPEIYEFMNGNDCTFSIKNNKFSGIVTDENGMKYNVNGKDYIVKNGSGSISIWTPEMFLANFTEVVASE